LAALSEYELVLMLDPEVADTDRDRIAADAQNRIEAAGNLKHSSVWGMRKMAYEIRQRTEADYRFFRFETEGPLLDELDHNLKIVDGVLRFRIFKVDPRSPVIVPPAPAPMASGPRRPTRSEDGDADAAPAPAAETAPAEEPAPPAAEPPAEEAPPVTEAAEAPPATDPADAPASGTPAPAEGTEPAEAPDEPDQG
jgi:ribosomal protein S6